MAKSESISNETLDVISDKTNHILSTPWKESDVVFLVEGQDIHVHRWILSQQSPVFKAMLHGNFKDAQEEKIELKGDSYEAMVDFLMLLYPPNMFPDIEVQVKDENILSILEVADKYEAVNVVKQCMKEVKNIQPMTTMRLLPYAAKFDLPVDIITDVITRHIAVENLKSFSHEVESDVLVKTLLHKCKHLESVVEEGNIFMIWLMEIISRIPPKGDRSFMSNIELACVEHSTSHLQGLEESRKCKNCLLLYKINFVDKCAVHIQCEDKSEILDLLLDADDIATYRRSETKDVVNIAT